MARRAPFPCVGCGGPKAPGRGYRWCEHCLSRGARDEHKRRYNAHKRRELFRRYGLRVEDFDALLLAQGGVCAMCGNASKAGHLSVDHDHATGAVRGLLCRRCNSGLGYVEDARWMASATSYLADPPAKRGLTAEATGMSTVTVLPTQQARDAAKAAHPATVSKQLSPAALVAAVAGTLGQVERQQMLHALVAGIGEDRLNPAGDLDLPLIVGVLLVAAPQTLGQPRLVAKALLEAANAHRASCWESYATVDGRTPMEWADEAAYGAAQLAAGTALVAAYGDLGDAQQLADWLTAAAQR